MVSCIHAKSMLTTLIFPLCTPRNRKLFYCEMFIFTNGVHGVGEYLDWCYCERSLFALVGNLFDQLTICWLNSCQLK